MSIDAASSSSAAPLELISHALCPYVQRAAAMLVEKGVPFTTRIVDLQAKPDWFLALSPRGKVPVLVAGGVPVFESAVIVEYLDEVHPPRLLPAAPLERAHQRAWLEVVNDVLVAQYKLAIAPSVAERGAAVASARAALARFEAELRGPFFAGEALGVVDLAIAPAFVRFELLETWLGLGVYADLPGVAAWSQRLTARPSIQATLAPDFAARFRAFVKDLGDARPTA